MHRRDCVLIAKTIREILKELVSGDMTTKNIIISAFYKSLKTENSSFNEQKFRDYIQKGE